MTQFLLSFAEVFLMFLKLNKKLRFNIDVTNDNKIIRNIEGRIARSVGILTKLRHLFPSSALLYYALIHPHLSFNLSIWGSTCPTYI